MMIWEWSRRGVIERGGPIVLVVDLSLHLFI